MNRRELFACCAAALLAGCRHTRRPASGARHSGLTSLDGVLATLRGECHPLDRRAATRLLAPTRALHQALSDRFDPPDVNFYTVDLLCDAARRRAAVESAAAGPDGATSVAWSSHRDRTARLRDELQGMLGTGNLSSIEPSMVAGEAALAAARATREADARRWALSDAGWLARDVQRGLKQRDEADEPRYVRFVELRCMASWRLLEAEVAVAPDAIARSEALSAHVGSLLRLGDELDSALDADYGPQLTAVAYHLRLAEAATTALGVPDATLAVPKDRDVSLNATAADACTHVLVEWDRRFKDDEPATPTFVREYCLWSARLAAAEDVAATSGDALHRHASRSAALLKTLQDRRTTAASRGETEQAVVRQAIAEADACLWQSQT